MAACIEADSAVLDGEIVYMGRGAGFVGYIKSACTIPLIKRGDQRASAKLRLSSLRSCIRRKYLYLHPSAGLTVTRYGQPLGGDNLVATRRFGAAWSWARLLSNALYPLRNEIVHYGQNQNSEGQYVAAIIDVALPSLEEAFVLFTGDEGAPVSLPKLLMEWIYREVSFAQAVL